MIEKLDRKIVQIMDEGVLQLLLLILINNINYAISSAEEYEWMPKEPMTTNSGFIRDILAYLESMFAALQLLPV